MMVGVAFRFYRRARALADFESALGISLGARFIPPTELENIFSR